MVTHAEWKAEGVRLFGADTKMRDWKFACPQCGHISDGQMFMDLFESQGMTSDTANQKAVRTVGQQCIGRFDPDVGCDWCAFGLFRGPREVTTIEWSDDDPTSLSERQDTSIWCFRFAEPS